MLKKRVVIILAMVLSYFVIKSYSGYIFVANTPKINRVFFAYLWDKFLAKKGGYYIRLSEIPEFGRPKFFIRKDYFRRALEKANKQIAPGVYAGEDGKRSIMVIYASQVRSLKTKK